VSQTKTLCSLCRYLLVRNHHRDTENTEVAQRNPSRRPRESELNAQDSQFPANRIETQTFTVIQLKIMQECITLVVFTVIAYLLFGQSIRWNHAVSYLLLVGAVYFTFAF